MNITIIGAGAWGTALGIHFALHGNRVALWTRNTEHAAKMQAERENKRYLSGFGLPEQLAVYSDMPSALESSELVLVTTAVAGLRNSAELLKRQGGAHLPVLAACKGFEPGSGLLPFQVLQGVLPENGTIGVLSGPSFAQELAQQLPCAVVLAAENEAWISSLVRELNTSVLRLYANQDVVGVAVGGAVKNVMAIAAGFADGIGYGMNARAALITRGLAEMTRLAAAMGAQEKTLMGLAGVGDLILTATGGLSRNRKVGLGLALGKSLAEVLGEIGHVAEGIPTVDEVCRAARRHQIDMPITSALSRLLAGEIGVDEVTGQLMLREAKFE